MAPQDSFPNHFQSNVLDYSFTEHSLDGFELQVLCLPQLASQSQPSGCSRMGQSVREDLLLALGLETTRC